MHTRGQREDKPVLLHAFYSLASADRLKAALESQGIRAFIAEESTASIMPHMAVGLGGIRLFVPASQIERAKAIRNEFLASTRRPAPEDLRVAAKRGEVTCPQCGGTDVVYGRNLSTIATLLLFFIVIGLVMYLLIPKRYRCQRCGAAWNP